MHASHKFRRRQFLRRNIVGFCCGEHSRLGNARYLQDGCTVTRLTSADDVTSKQGLNKCLRAARSANVLLWAFIPCTGGSQWQNFNKIRPGGASRLREHLRNFVQIWDSFKIAALECLDNGGGTWRPNGRRTARIGAFQW